MGRSAEQTRASGRRTWRFVLSMGSAIVETAHCGPGRAILGVLSVLQTGVQSAWKRAEDAQRDARYEPACPALERPSPAPPGWRRVQGFPGRPCGRRATGAGLTFCCAYSKALP